MSPTTEETIPIELRGAPRRIKEDLERGTVAPAYLMAGPAGTGKTFGTLFLFHLLACEFAGSRWLFARKTRESITQSLLPTFENGILGPDGFGPMARQQRRSHRSSYIYPNGSEIVLAGFDKPEKILSTSYDGAYVNEALEIAEEDHQTLSGRFDRPDHKCPATLYVLDCNPGHPEHWLKKLADDGAKVVHLESKHRDNPGLWARGKWTALGERYMARLDTLTGVWRKRFLAGVWAAGAGVWFSEFDPAENGRDVNLRAEYDPRLEVRLALDPGVHTGAVLFQVAELPDGRAEVRVFADHLGKELGIGDNVRAIKALAESRCEGRLDRRSIDPAAGAKTGFGLVTIEEYRRCGLDCHPWPRRTVLEGLNLLGSFIGAGLVVHPRCKHLITAMGNYKRKKVGEQFVDAPEDPQHPYEDLVDALRCGLIDKWPDGRKPDLKLRRKSARDVF